MGKVLYVDANGENEQVIEYDDELSFRDFTGWDFTDRPKYDFNGKTIYASVFTNETPDSDIFNQLNPGEGTFSLTTTVTFVKCHLQNIILPKWSRILDCFLERFQVQNDSFYWIVDEQNNPIEPLYKKLYEKYGLKIPEPKDIPAVPVEKPLEFEDLKPKGG